MSVIKSIYLNFLKQARNQAQKEQKVNEEHFQTKTKIILIWFQKHVDFEFFFSAYLPNPRLQFLLRFFMIPRNSQYGRGRGSFRDTADKAQTPQKGGQRSSIRAKKNVNFDPKEYMVAECSVRDIQIFKQVFDFLDDDYDGMLTPMDLRKAIRDFGGYKPGRPFVYVAMSVFDADDGGEITFKEFVKLMTYRPCQADTEDDIQRIFQNFDQEGKGHISEQDLLAAAEELQEEVTPAQIRQMINHCDPEGQGKISLEAFIAFNKRKNFD